MQAVDGAQHLAAHDDRHVDDGFAAERADQFMVVEDRADTLDVIGDEGLLVLDDLPRPVGEVGGLGAGDRIGLGHVRIDAARHALLAVMGHDGEQLHADDVTRQLPQRRECRLRLRHCVRRRLS